MCQALIESMFSEVDTTFWSATQDTLMRRLRPEWTPAIPSLCRLLSHKKADVMSEFVSAVWDKWSLRIDADGTSSQYLVDLRDEASKKELYVAVVLALLVKKPHWPPPPDHIERILELVDRYSTIRGPQEIVLACLLGWERELFGRDVQGCDGVNPGAKSVLADYARGSVSSCISALENCCVLKAGGLEPMQRTAFADLIAERATNQLLAERNACQCWADVANAGNHQRAVEKCARWHNISAWDPSDCSLWAFLQRGVKGFSGNTQGFMTLRQLPSGLFWYFWNSEAIDDVPALQVAKIAVPKAEEDKSFENDHLEILKGHVFVAGSLVAKSFWTCGKCGILFEARYCADAESCRGATESDGPHDRCPECGEHRHKGKGARATTAFTDPRIYEMLCGQQDGPDYRNLADLLEHAEERENLPEWQSVIVVRVIGYLQAGLRHRALGLVSPNDEFEWQTLYEFLEGCSDRPANVDELDAVYRRELVPFFMNALATRG